jgi:hypothetical protein
MHTKGPWKVDGGDPTMVTAIRNGKFFHVADARGWGRLQYEKCGEKEQEANARLIAAAPEMLEYLSELFDVECWKHRLLDDRWQCKLCLGVNGHQQDCTVIKAESLLSKIKGGQE